MRELDVGGRVFLIRFLPDNQRMVVGATDQEQKVVFQILSLPDGARIPLNVPRTDLNPWYYHSFYGNVIAISPGGDLCYLAWAEVLYAFRTADGEPVPVPNGIRAHQVVISPDGGRLLAAHRTDSQRQLFAATTGPEGAVVWHKEMPKEFVQVAGFLPDGKRFVTVDASIRIGSFDTGDQLAASRTKQKGAQQPQISPDGTQLGLVGYGNMYFWDLTALGKPRKIGGSRAFGDFRSFAFHPSGKTVAVIHGGPTLVKVYDLATLERVQTWKWKLGPLNSVAFSPDGMLGAVGSEHGRIVVWDVDG